MPTLFKLVGEIGKDGTGHVAKLKLAELFPETELVSFHDKKMWAAKKIGRACGEAQNHVSLNMGQRCEPQELETFLSSNELWSAPTKQQNWTNQAQARWAARNLSFSKTLSKMWSCLRRELVKNWPVESSNWSTWPCLVPLSLRQETRRCEKFAELHCSLKLH